MHGGDIYKRKIKLDFSVNVNPYELPKPVMDAMYDSIKQTRNYPDINCRRLTERLSKKFKVPYQNIVCGNGASELIMAICHAIRPKRAVLFAPGFSGYIHALNALDADINFCYDISKMADCIKEYKPDIVFVTNPNNPTGQLVEAKVIDEIKGACDSCNGKLVIDECFIELTGKIKEYSYVPKLSEESDNVVVLGAFTKSFAIPGVRVGYALFSSHQSADSVKKQLPEWNVSIIAQSAAIAALDEMEYVYKSVGKIEKERIFLREQLEKKGYRVFDSQANYILFEDVLESEGKGYLGGNKRLYDSLIDKEILIRDCSDYEGLNKGFYRISVRTHKENEILLQNM